MRKFYQYLSAKFVVAGLLLMLPSLELEAEYFSIPPGGDFSVGSSWAGGQEPTETWRTLTIVENSEITYVGDFTWQQTVTINGGFSVVGNLSCGYGGLDIGPGANVEVAGSFTGAGSLFVGNQANVIVEGDFSIGGGVTANIYGDLEIRGDLIGDGTNFIIHDGVTVTVNNVDANVGVEVRDGGTLIVNGYYKNGQNLTIQAGGFVEVKGSEGFNSGGALNNYGLLLVAGDYVNNSGGNGLSVLGQGYLDIGGDLIANMSVRVDPEAVLIVRGSVFYEGGQSGMYIDGTMIVKEDFTITNGSISNTGKVVVGGAFTFEGGGFTSPDQQASGEANLYLLDEDADHVYIDYDVGSQVNSKSGDLDDFLVSEADSWLMDLVGSVMPERVPPGSSNREYQWVGGQNNRWNDHRNWNGWVPVAGVNTLIQSGTFDPVIEHNNGLIDLKNLTIQADAKLTLNPGARLTVSEDLSVAYDGGLVLKNTTRVNGLASLIIKGEIVGDARQLEIGGEVQVELEFPFDEWYYVSQPIQNAKSDIYAILDGDENFSAAEAWVNIHRANRWYRIGTDVDIAPLEGLSNKYRPAGGADHVVSYTGKLNNDPISKTYSNQQYYLFGNPYPSAINWQEDTGWERNNIGGTFWYRTRVNNEMAFVTYNRFADEGARVSVYPGGEDFSDEESLALIPPLQSVWISSLGSSSISINKAAQMHVLEGTFLKSSRGSNVVRITTENNTGRDGTVIYFSPNAEEGIDRGDSEKMFNESVDIPEIYTRVGNHAVAINGMPSLEDKSQRINLSVRNRIAGDVVTLRFDMGLYTGVHTPYLEDQEEGVMVNLLQDHSYTYTVRETGDSHDRFSLHFHKVSTDFGTPPINEIEPGQLISIKRVSGKVLVSADLDLLKVRGGRVEIFNIEGRKVNEIPALSSRTLVALPAQSGVYIVRAQFGIRVQSERVIVSGD